MPKLYPLHGSPRELLYVYYALMYLRQLSRNPRVRFVVSARACHGANCARLEVSSSARIPSFRNTRKGEIKRPLNGMDASSNFRKVDPLRLNVMIQLLLTFSKFTQSQSSALAALLCHGSAHCTDVAETKLYQKELFVYVRGRSSGSTQPAPRRSSGR